MTLLRSEFLKTFRKPYVPISLLILTVVNFAAIFFTNQGSKSFFDIDALDKICLEKLCGPIDKNKIDYVLSEEKRLTTMVLAGEYSTEFNPNTYTGYEFGDFNLFNGKIAPILKYAVNYPYVMQDVLLKAKDNISFYQDVGNTAKVNESYEILRLYSNRTIDDFQNLTGPKYLLYYDFSGLLIILLLMLTLSPVFVSEKENRMSQLLPTFVKGSTELLNTKLLFVIMITIAYCLWFFIIDLIGFSLFSNMRGLYMPLYAISEFQFTPIKLSILQFHLLSFLLKTLGIILIAVFIAFASKVFSKILHVFISGLFPLIIFLVWKFKSASVLTFLDFINPALLIKNRYLFMSYKPMVLGNFLIQPVVIATIAIAVMLLIFCFLIKIKVHPQSS